MRTAVAEEVHVTGIGKCPRCGSSDLQTMEAIAQNGVSIVDSYGSYSGVSWSTVGVVPVLGTSSQFEIRRSALAVATAPSPPLRNWAGTALLSAGWLLLWLPFFTLVTWLMLSDAAERGADFVSQASGVLFGLMFAVPALIGLIVVARNVRINRRIRRGMPVAHQLWRGGRYCLRCAGCFWPTSPPTGISTAQVVTPVEFQRIVWRAGFSAVQ
ncbi:Uncharacterised protein [Nocardia africana]|uniref:Uncharacterized protein n=2 Tax=Nocardiaceae TaxID=85025 RepID=A0A378X7N5_9NOCA|nr:Uncharacterised protein [Nocardia africana]